MKMRIHGNSIRMRLNRPEVARFAGAGHLEQCFEYGREKEDRLVYALEVSKTASESEVRVTGKTISIVLPEALAQAWTGTERVGITVDIPVAEGKQMTVLVEKEFRRLHGANHDLDLYPNPLESHLA